MSRGGTVKEQLDAVQKQLDAEQELWTSEGLPDPGAVWKFGPGELHASLRIDTIVQVLNEHLGITEDQMNLILKKRLLQVMKELRPVIKEAKTSEARMRILDGIDFRPPPDVIPPNN